MIGETISHYRILEKLGEGGMGTVYKAEDTNLRRTVALKIANEKDRFLREAQAAASLNHTNICTIFEIDEASGLIAMELVDGQSLKDKIAERPLPLEEAIDLTIQICHGLQHAHERSVVHRDIKPANIMLSAKGQVKIMDFGLAQIGDRTRITQTGTAVGTPAYMSPEQTRAEPVDRRSDLWSLGVVLYEMIAGLPPFKGDTPGAVTYNIVNTQPEPLTALRTGLPIELDRIMSKALRKNQADRYSNAEDLAVDLRHALAHRPAGKGRAPKWIWPAAAIALLGGVASIFLRDRTPPIPSPASYQQITAFSDSVVQPALSSDERMVAFIRGATLSPIPAKSM